MKNTISCLLIIYIITFLSSCVNPDQYKKNASRYFINENYELALKEINKYIELEPDSVDGYSLRILIYAHERNLSAELDDLEKVISINNSIRAHHERALVYMQLNEFSKALDDINFFIKAELEKKDVNRDTVIRLKDAYLNKATILYKLGKEKESKALYNYIIENETEKNLISQAYLGLSLSEESNYKAIKLLNKALKYDAKNAKAYGERAKRYVDSDQIKEAANDFQSAITYEPDNEINFYNLAMFLADFDLDKALEVMNMAVEKNPYNRLTKVMKDSIIYWKNHQ